MNPKDKAKELFDKYYVLIFDIDSGLSEEILVSILSKRCALLAAENIRTEMVQSQNYERAIYFRDVKSQIKML